MITIVRIPTLLMIVAMCAALQGTAAAQSSVVASLGKLYGGGVQTSSKTLGIALGGSGAHNVGSELEYAQTGHVTDLAGHDSKVLSLMASLLVAAHVGPVRPYGLFGIGFIRQRTAAFKAHALEKPRGDDAIRIDVVAAQRHRATCGFVDEACDRHYACTSSRWSSVRTSTTSPAIAAAATMAGLISSVRPVGLPWRPLKFRFDDDAQICRPCS